MRVASANLAVLTASSDAERKKAQTKAKRTREFEGCRSENPFARIPYVNLQDLSPVPAGHAILYGLACNFVEDISRNPSADGNMVEYLLSAEQKRLIRSRSKDITVTSEFGRGYRCVLDYRWEIGIRM